MTTIGSRLRALRLRRGIKLTDAAVCSGMSKGHLSCIERDIQTNPGIECLRALAAYYGVPVASLLGEHPPHMDLRVQPLAEAALGCDDEVLELLEQIARRLAG